MHRRTSARDRALLVCAALIGAALLAAGCSSAGGNVGVRGVRPTGASELPTATPEAYALVRAALTQVGVTTSYDPSYVKIAYPNGDVPIETGVCTDVVVRAFRGVGVDLQQLVHEDMAANFELYPRRWNLTGPDPNIDHRRVPNLEVYFDRQGWRVPIAEEGSAYLPGDIVTWQVAKRPHIGIVSAEESPAGARYLVIHNIGQGTQVADDLFRFEITGHFRPR